MPKNQHKSRFTSKIKKFQMVEPDRNIISKKCLIPIVSNFESRLLLTQMLDISTHLLPLRALHFNQRNYLRWLLYQLKQFQFYKLQLTVVQLLKFPTLYSIDGGCCLELPKNRRSSTELLFLDVKAKNMLSIGAES